MKRLVMFSALVLPLSAEVVSVAHPAENFPAEATVVWTPLFQAAWDRLNEYHGGKPVKVEPPNELIARLDAFAWKAQEVMPEGRWKVWAGEATEEFLAEANAGAAELTGEAQGPFRLENRLPGTVAVFGLLDREVVFRKPFYRSRRAPMSFTAGNGEKREVKFFGVRGEESEEVGTFVRVLAYRPSEKCHALQILCRGGDDTVVLFRPPGAQDFATACEWLRTWRKAWKPEPESSFRHNDRLLHEDDEVRVPYVKLEAVRDFAGELDSLRFYKGHADPWRIQRAEQRVEFELHERGARVRAEVSLEDPFGGDTDGFRIPPYPRRFAYDVPFFVFLWRDGAEWPYFGAWVGDVSAMEGW